MCKLNSANCNLDVDETAGAAGDHSSQPASQPATCLSENESANIDLACVVGCQEEGQAAVDLRLAARDSSWC